MTDNKPMSFTEKYKAIREKNDALKIEKENAELDKEIRMETFMQIAVLFASIFTLALSIALTIAFIGGLVWLVKFFWVHI